MRARGSVAAWVVALSAIAGAVPCLGAARGEEWSVRRTATPRASLDAAIARLVRSPYDGRVARLVLSRLGPRDGAQLRERLAALAGPSTARPAILAAAGMVWRLPPRDLERAIAIFSRLIDREPGDWQARLALAQTLVQAGQAAQAEAAYAAALIARRAAGRPDDPKLSFAQAEVMANAGHPDAAFSTLVGLAREPVGREVLSRESGLSLLRHSALAARRLFELKDVLARIGRERPRDRRLAAALDKTRMLLGEVAPETSGETSGAPHGRAPGPATQIDHVIATLGAGSSDEERARRFAAALVRFHREPEALSRLADAAAARRRDDWSLAAWQAVLRVQPFSARALTAAGEIHFQHGRRELARSTWSRLLLGAPQDSPIQSNLAALFLDHDDLESAEKHARRVIARIPLPACEARVSQGEGSDRCAGLREAVRVLGEIHERRKNLPAVADTFRTLARLAGRPELENVRRDATSRLLSALSRLGPAALLSETEPLRAKLERGGLAVDEIILLADLETRLRQPERAIAVLRRAGRQFPAEPRIAMELFERLRARTLIGSPFLQRRLSRDGGGDGQGAALDLDPQREAEHALQEFAARNPGKAQWAWAQLGEVAAQRGRWPHALALTERALATPAGNERGAGAGRENTWVRASEIAERARFFTGADAGDGARPADQALSAASLAVGAQAGSGRALFNQARVLFRRGDLAAAGRLLQTAARAHPATLAASLLTAGLPAAELEDELSALEEVVAQLIAGGAHDLDDLEIVLLQRLVPPLHERRFDPAVAARLRRISQLGLAPLIRKVNLRPDADNLLLLGLLGRPESGPVLRRALRTALGETGGTEAGRGLRGGDQAHRQRQTRAEAAAYALGLLGAADAVTADLARGDLLRALDSELPPVRLAALWALSQTDAREPAAADAEMGAVTHLRAQVTAALERATEDRTRIDDSALACLILAKRGAAAEQRLLGIVADHERAPMVRRAAALALGLTPASPQAATEAHPLWVPALERAVAGGLDPLARAAAATLSARAGADAFNALWRQVLDAGGDALHPAAAALATFGQPLGQPTPTAGSATTPTFDILTLSAPDLPIQVDRLLLMLTERGSSPPENFAPAPDDDLQSALFEHADLAAEELAVRLREAGGTRTRTLRALRAIAALLRPPAAAEPGSSGPYCSAQPCAGTLPGAFAAPLQAVLRGPLEPSRSDPGDDWLAFATLRQTTDAALTDQDFRRSFASATAPIEGLSFEDRADTLRAALPEGGVDVAPTLRYLGEIVRRTGSGRFLPPEARRLAVRLLNADRLRKHAAADLQVARRDPDPLVRWEAASAGSTSLIDTVP